MDYHDRGHEQAQDQQSEYYARADTQMAGAYGNYPGADRFRQTQSAHDHSSAEAARGLQTLSEQVQPYQAQSLFRDDSMQGVQHVSQMMSQPQVGTARTLQQQMPQYAPSMPHPGQHMTPMQSHAFHDQIPQYASRSSMSAENASSHFAMPETPQQYLANLQRRQSYQQVSYDQPATSSGYGDAGQMLPPNSYSSYQQYHQTQQQHQQQQQQLPEAPLSQNQDENPAFSEYLSRVRNIFERVRDGELASVGHPLVEISRYLIGNVGALGENNCTRHLQRSLTDSRS